MEPTEVTVDPIQEVVDAVTAEAQPVVPTIMIEDETEEEEVTE